MKRYWKGSDMRLDINITDKKGEEIPLSSIMSMTIYLFTSGQEYVEYNYPQSILEDDKGLYIPINENALAYLPDGLLRWEANFKVKDIEWPDGRDIVKSCQTDIFVKTPRDYVAKPNVQAKEISITENGEYEVLPDAGYEGISRMTINVDIPMSIKVGENRIKFSYSTFTEIPQVFDFSDVVDWENMFYRCYSLQRIDKIDVSSAENMRMAFYYCGVIESISFKAVPTPSDCRSIFSNCNLLKEIPFMDISMCTSMDYMFCECWTITTIPAVNTSKVTSILRTFDNCMHLQSLPELDFSNVTDTTWSFRDCSSLTDLEGFVGLKTNLDLSYCTRLTHDSLMNVINKAADVTPSPATLTLGFTNLAKLSDEEKAVATAKGWTLA